MLLLLICIIVGIILGMTYAIQERNTIQRKQAQIESKVEILRQHLINEQSKTKTFSDNRLDNAEI